MIVFKDIQIKAIKALVILSYCFINIIGKHVGGYLIMFLFSGLTNGGSSLFHSTIMLLSLFGLIFTIFKPNIKRDKILIPILSLALIVPLIMEFKQTFTHLNWSNNNKFIVTFIIFILFDIILIIQTLRQKKITN